jgi:hypothetical protein
MAPRVTFTGLAIFALALVVLLPARGATPNPRFSITISATEHTTWSFDACWAHGVDGSCSATYVASGTDDSTFATAKPVVVTLAELRDAPRFHVLPLVAHTDRSVNATWQLAAGELPPPTGGCGARDFTVPAFTVFVGYDPADPDDPNAFKLHIDSAQRVYPDSCTPFWVWGFYPVNVLRPVSLATIAARPSTVVSGHDVGPITDSGGVTGTADVQWAVRIKRL